MKKISILLISGDLQYSQKAENFFVQFDYHLTIIKNTKDAIKFIRDKDFDIIVCQLTNRNLDGLALLQEIKGDPKTAKIPFILLGNNFSNHLHRKVMMSGGDDILFLPYSFFDLQASIVSILNKNQVLLHQCNRDINRLRESITNSLPHEMRTALTGIIAASELLHKKQHILKPDTVTDMIHCINSSAKRLSDLVGKFLLYSELESTAKDHSEIKSLRKSTTFNVKKIIAEMAVCYSKKYSREADFILKLDDGCVQIRSDNFYTLVEELIDNACKFSSSGTPIKIISRVENSQYILKIIDRGRGMTSQQIANINFGVQFDRVVQEQQGFGLGLVIARNLVKLYGGNLLITSILNKETNISVTLPLAQPKIESKQLKLMNLE